MLPYGLIKMPTFETKTVGDKTTISKIADFPTVEDILKTCPKYLAGPHISMDTNISGNILCVKGDIIKLDLKVSDNFVPEDSIEYDIIMTLIAKLYDSWIASLCSLAEVKKSHVCLITFEGDGYRACIGDEYE